MRDLLFLFSFVILASVVSPVFAQVRSPEELPENREEWTLEELDKYGGFEYPVYISPPTPTPSPSPSPIPPLTPQQCCDLLRELERQPSTGLFNTFMEFCSGIRAGGPDGLNCGPWIGYEINF